MLTPDYLLHISEGAEAVSEELHTAIVEQIVKRIMLRIGRGEDYILTPYDKWQLETLQDAGYLMSDIQKEIAKKSAVQLQTIQDAFEDAGVTAIRYDAGIYKRVGLENAPLSQSPALLRVVEAGCKRTFKEWKNFTGTTANAAQRLFISECDRVYKLVASGVTGYRQAVKSALNNIATEGVTVVYPSGWKDSIETATLRAVRTGIGQTCAQVTVERAIENGVTTMLTSSHIGARPEHELWQGEVFWVDWNAYAAAVGGLWETDVTNAAEASDEEKRKYREFVSTTEIGSVTGLCGVNCRHSFSPYFDGVSSNPFEKYDSEENRKAYETSQRQRAYERRIRKTKREVATYKTAFDNAESDAARDAIFSDLQKAQKLLAKQNKEYAEFCDANGLKQLQDRLVIGLP